MENLLMIAAAAAGDFAVWVCAHCETNNTGDAKICVVCDMGRWTSCDIECEHSIRPAPASVAVYVNLDAVPLPPPPHMLNACVQVPLPYMWEWEIPANYKDLADVEREGALQLEMHLF